MELLNRFNISKKWRECVRVTVFASSLLTLIFAVWQIVIIDYTLWGIALFFSLYGLLSVLKKEVKLLKWLGKNSFLIYLIEQKLIDFLEQFAFLGDNIMIYTLCYSVVIVVIVSIYRFCATYLGRYRSLLELETENYKMC